MTDRPTTTTAASRLASLDAYRGFVMFLMMAEVLELRAVAKALLELETIDADQIDDIMTGKPPRPPRPTSSGSGTSAPGSAAGPDAAPSANP
ncbi:MAG: hypothetical protein ACOYK7_09155, partial [Pirellulales bacterium]